MSQVSEGLNESSDSIMVQLNLLSFMDQEKAEYGNITAELILVMCGFAFTLRTDISRNASERFSNIVTCMMHTGVWKKALEAKLFHTRLI